MEVHSSKVRVGIVGLGGHGGNIQLSAQKSDRVEVVAVCDPNEEELAASIERFGCDGYREYSEMLDKSDFDAVVLVTPNHLHKDQTLAAFERGLDVMVEKPIANTVQDGLAMIEAAESHDRLLYVGHNMRFSLAYDAMKGYIDAGKLGKVITAEIHFSADNTRWLPEDSWRLDPSLCPMMPVMQLGVHGIDVMQSFLGPIVSVSAFKDAFTTRPGVTDSVTAAVKYAAGALGTLVSNYCTQVAFDFRISGTEATVFSTPHRGWYRKATETDSHCEGPKERFDYLEQHALSFERQMNAFAAFVLDGVRSGATPADALRAVAVVEALSESAETGQTVEVRQVTETGAIT